MDLRGLELSNVTSVDSLFAGCTSLNSVDLSDVQFTSADSLNGMFSGCVKLSDVRLNGCNMSAAIEMDSMFMDCASLTSIDLSGLGAANVYSTSRMFKGCTYLESVSMDGWDTSGLVDVHEMFADCESLSEIDFSQTDLSSVETASGMFSGCTNLESAKLSAFSACVSELDGMFSKCTSLKTVELSVNATANKPTAMGMFEDCTSLEELDLSALQGELADTSLMFSGCTALTALDISGARIITSGDEAAYTDEMFLGCGMLRALTVSPGTSITEEMCLNNGNPLESGWIVKGDDTMTVISGDGETAVIPAPAEKTAYVWKNSDLSRFAGHSLSLNGDIGVNFFIRLTEEEAAYATVDFTWIVNGEEKTATVYMSDAEKTDHGYKATCHIAPAEMTYQITATIELDGTEHTDIYAAADYADVILTDSEFASKYVAAENIKGKDGDQRLADLRYLVKTMLDYGAKAQIQFKRDSEVELANKKLVTDDQTSPYYFKPGEVDANSITTGADNMYEADFSNLGLEYKGTTIVFLTETSLRHYFKITDQGKFDLVKGSINFGSDEKIGYTEKNGEIYFELKNIAAADLDTLCTLIINGDPYKYSVLEYVKACLKSTKTSDNMKALAAATYRYNQAANVYFV